MSETAHVLSTRRKVLFAAVLSVLTALVLLGTLELALRIFGYGYSPHFARRAKTTSGETVWRENRWATAPFFSPERVRRPLPFRLPEKKPPGTYRIFVLGSSAAMGDPEPSFSLARMLETMLRAAYPQQRFEVVNAAITAINSHIVRGIAADCAQLEPDLFIVYEGNNEVIGPFGPSGVFTPFIRNETLLRIMVWLKCTRTGQLVSAIRRNFFPRHAEDDGWRGMQMFLDQQIAATDPRLLPVRNHFAENLRAIARSANAVHAGTLLCTVLTNQRDFAPFLSQHRPDLAAPDVSAWESAVDAATSAARTGDLASAEAAYRQALAIDDQHAELCFRLGRLLLQSGRDAEAQPLLRRAQDLDALRFRTDTALNDVIRHVEAPDATLVDLAAKLGERSPHGLPGDELLYEHVHLTLRGAYDIAAELMPRVSADLVHRGLVQSPSAALIDYNEARLRLGYTTYEQGMIAVELLNRFKAAPFTQQADHAARLAVWQRRVEAANALLAREDATPALREIYERALAAAPDDWILARNAGAMLVARQSAGDALPLLERAAAIIPDDVDTQVALGWAYREVGNAEKSDAAFAAARALEPQYPGLPADRGAHAP